jgi:hypothetical protein
MKSIILIVFSVVVLAAMIAMRAAAFKRLHPNARLLADAIRKNITEKSE